MEENEKLERNYEGYQQFKEDIPSILETVQSIAKAETQILEELQQVFDDGKELELAPLSEDSETLKLSLVFNIAGLSANTIRKLSHLSGKDFIDLDIEKEFVFDDFESFGEYKNIFYCQMMFIHRLSLDIHHHKALCRLCCKSESSLENLFLDFELEDEYIYIKDKAISGCHLLTLSENDLTSSYFNLSTEQAKTFIEAIEPLKNLHHLAILKTT